VGGRLVPTGLCLPRQSVLVFSLEADSATYFQSISMNIPIRDDFRDEHAEIHSQCWVKRCNCGRAKKLGFQRGPFYKINCGTNPNRRALKVLTRTLCTQ